MCATPRFLVASSPGNRLRYGTIGKGLDLCRQAWSSEVQVFSAQDRNMCQELPSRPKTRETKPVSQLRAGFLNEHPTDALLVDEGDGKIREATLTLLQKALDSRRPKVVVISGPTERLIETKPREQTKQRRKRLERLGYQSVEWLLHGTEQGGAVDQSRLIEVFYRKPREDWPLPRPPSVAELPPRDMCNLLLPCGIPRNDWAPTPAIRSHSPMRPPHSPYIYSGTIQGAPIYHRGGCMPDRAGAWIDSERGVRRLQTQEWAKGLGLPNEWLAKGAHLPKQVVEGATSIHIWTPVCDAVSEWLTIREAPEAIQQPPPSPWKQPDLAEPGANRDPHTKPTSSEESPPWDYALPDLSPGSKWYQERLTNLKRAVQGRPDADLLLREGLEALEVHRGNFTKEGPKYLQVLWWEFPEEHQDEVRRGSSMRFLIDPGEELVPNPPMTAEQVQVVAEFVDELQSLGVVRKATRKLRRVCPIFVVPKPGQPGQWRCIADMRRGGQNSCCSLDPIYLPGAKDILPHLYSGGWSAVADASKYFHNYLTLPEERDLIGIIHPITGEELWYVGLPMGSVNSPSIACRFGEGLLGRLRREKSVFRADRYLLNTWAEALAGEAYDPGIGHGYVGIQVNGRPVALIFGFVDDFLIHAATYDDCCLALNAFMDLMVRVGIVCQPVKTSPPAQIQKYCGFLYDTTNTPTLRIPPNKISRCLACIDFLLYRPRTARLSRLSLAIITGILQSVVVATPQHVGQNHLRSLYEDLHTLEEGLEATGAAKYYTWTAISAASLEALRWWKGHLGNHPGYTTSRAQSRNGLVLKWGDGSGTGTGGTTELVPLTQDGEGASNLELWMGVWTAKSRPNSSNWKEARTVLESLLQERSKGRLEGCVVFYFTDNLVSYYIINGGSSRSPGLHALVLEIKELAASLGCHLEVVHVPGKMMIVQGTDGLSRGLWLSSSRRDPQINQQIFLPVIPSPELGIWALQEAGVRNSWPCWLDYSRVRDWRCVLHRCTLWAPPPECARQVLVAYLSQWVQDPWDTQAIFLVPRVLQRDWGRVAKYIREVGVYCGELLPEPARFEAHIPFVLLHIAPHVPTLRADRMGLPPKAKPPMPHWEQAEEVRGLS